MLNGKLEMKPNVHRIIYEFRLAEVGIGKKKKTTKNSLLCVLYIGMCSSWQKHNIEAANIL